MKRDSVDRLQFLKETHRVLDTEIQNAQRLAVSEWMIKDMKKRKLELKDQIENMEKELRGDV